MISTTSLCDLRARDYMCRADELAHCQACLFVDHESLWSRYILSLIISVSSLINGFFWGCYQLIVFIIQFIFMQSSYIAIIIIITEHTQRCFKTIYNIMNIYCVLVQPTAGQPPEGAGGSTGGAGDCQCAATRHQADRCCSTASLSELGCVRGGSDYVPQHLRSNPPRVYWTAFDYVNEMLLFSKNTADFRSLQGVGVLSFLYIVQNNFYYTVCFAINFYHENCGFTWWP